MTQTEGCPCGKDGRVSTIGVSTTAYAVTGVIQRCERCGFVKVDGAWKGICATCKKEVPELFGFFVPHLCKACCDAEVTRQRETGQVCRLCRNVYLFCAC
jgi:hypothetical protein